MGKDYTEPTANQANKETPCLSSHSVMQLLKQLKSILPTLYQDFKLKTLKIKTLKTQAVMMSTAIEYV